jgi:hypothetical protein
MWWREVAAREKPTSEIFVVSSGESGGIGWLAMFFSGF